MFSLKNQQDLDRAIELAEQYRSEFFKYPRGNNAFRNATPSDALAMNLENLEIAESFHYEFCFKCKVAKEQDTKPNQSSIKLNLVAVSGAYCFMCDKCKPKR